MSARALAGSSCNRGQALAGLAAAAVSLAAFAAISIAGAQGSVVPQWETLLPQHENREYLGKRPRTRYSHTATPVGAEVIVAFGYFYDHWDNGAATWHTDIWALNGDASASPTKRWRLVTAGKGTKDPVGRMNHVAVPAPGSKSKLVVFGGSTLGHAKLSDIWELDVLSGSWTQLVPKNEPPSGRDCFSAVLLGTSMVVYGGFHLGDLWEYNFKTQRWKLLMDQPQVDHKGHPGKRAAHSAVTALNTKDMYVYGGFRFESDVTDAALGSGKLEDLWLYTSADNKWHLMPQVGGAQGGRQFFGMELVPWWKASSNGELLGKEATSHGLVVFGGTLCPTATTCRLVGSTTVYSLDEHRWYSINVKEDPLHRYHHSLSFCEDALWHFGGETYQPHMYHNSVNRLAWPPPVSAATPLETARAAEL